MILSSVLLYFYINYFIEGEMEEELYSSRFRLENYLEDKGNPIALSPIFEVKEVNRLKEETLKDTVIFDPSQNETELFRELTSYTTIHNRNYQIIVRSMVVESENISLAILFSFLVIILAIFMFQFYFSKAWNKILWRPFFTNLKKMKEFSVKSESPIVLEDSNILEFSELKDEISALTNKVTSDYQLLKQFTEDVSHELQTPLAIMQAKIENLLNSSGIKQEQFNNLASLQKDIQRLAQLNKKLVLLTKIENRQFINPKNIDLNALVLENIQNFREIATREILFSAEAEIVLFADLQLVQILFNNLLSNALKYGMEEGVIEVLVKDKKLIVANKGEKPLQNSEKLFTRFFKGEGGKPGTGLGLAIVKKVCDFYNYRITYNFSSHKHIFTINFPEAEVSNS